MEMYQCIDHTLPHEEAEGKREECFEKVLKKYKKFEEEWDATHGLVVRHDVNITTNVTVRTNVTTQQDVNKTTTKAAVRKNEKHAVAAQHDVNRTSTNATATVHAVIVEVSADDLKMIQEECRAACSKAQGSTNGTLSTAQGKMCTTHCEADMYTCIKETPQKQCRKEAKAKYEVRRW